MTPFVRALEIVKPYFNKERPFEPTDLINSLLKVSFPLMIGSLSTSLMLLFDRFFLAHYSLNSLNSAVTVGSLILMLQIGANICASTADVFVGQLNGGNKRTELGQPTWQMIWFSLLTALFFIPASFFPNFFLPKESYTNPDIVTYFTFLTMTASLFPLGCALSSFFIGKKETRKPLYSCLIGNLVNLTLNYPLIFGIQSLSIPELGIKGAAIATIIGQLVQIGILFKWFLSKDNQQEHMTHVPRFERGLFCKILKVGYPNALAQSIIASAWACFFYLMNSLGEESLTIATLMQSLSGFFTFIIIGLCRGVSSLASNSIGQGSFTAIPPLLWSGIKLCFCFSLLVLALFLLFPSQLIQSIFTSQDSEKVIHYLYNLQLALLWAWLSFLFKAVRNTFSGILTAAGKTNFILLNETISVWLFFFLPTWIAITYFDCNVTSAYFMAFAYNFLATVVYYRVFRSIDWCTEAVLID